MLLFHSITLDFSSSLSIPTSQSFPFFPFFIPQTSNHQSPNKFRSLALQTLCSCQKIELQTQNRDTQKSRTALKGDKKKRKLRPSFYDQVRDRWSAKYGSQREKFPWQEQIEKGEERGEESEEERGSVAVDSSSIDESDPVSFSLGNRVVSAPWIPRSEFSKPHLSSQSETAKNAERNEIEKLANNVIEFEEEQKIEGFRSVVEIDNSSYSSTLIDNAGESEKGFSVGGEDFSFDEEMVELNGNEVNFAGSSSNGDSISMPWERDRGVESKEGEKWGRRNTELAEKTIPEHELRRLRNVSLRMKERIKVGAVGITQALVDTIHEKWKLDEVVKIKFEGPPACNMRRTHEILENRSGGLVIWRSGSSLVLYRGLTYKLPCIQAYTKLNTVHQDGTDPLKNLNGHAAGDVGASNSLRIVKSSVAGYSLPNNLSEKELNDLSVLNELLDGLGPRFKDWSGRDPQPVDADLLPNVVPGYTPPFRHLPYGVNYSLTNKEMTLYRRLARITPPHFALGRNRELQGLAKAMVKLWEKNAIAKIAIKRGVLNTRNERMAEELKNLTGGTLISRNMEYVVFYRGNDFLPPRVTEVLFERKKLVELQQDEEELARQRASLLTISNVKASKVPLVAGTLAETIAATSRWGNEPSSDDIEKMRRDFTLAKHASVVRCLENKLVLARLKFKKAENALAKVQESLNPTDLPTDLETITDEERFTYRKIGLSMKPFLLLGTRGVFDGIVENIHLHWKFREVVKVIVRGKNFRQVQHIAISLEAESGGLLISVDKTSKGDTIIIYRGKNYQRPSVLRPKNLLTKRQALARSIELQRHEALLHHISDLQERIDLLKGDLMKAVKETGSEEFYARLSHASDDDSEDDDEGEEAFLETYNSSDEGSRRAP
ncbi:hypothetical protein Sjap_011653 [Stephania japonica]|uniref:CRM domain-containing protein n=1 Tax=Stephania japonica TaxID=461633 RepID=A0AAP0JBR5_9MAGN